MYGLKETDETAKDSKEFLRIFSEFFRNSCDCLVSVEKKRGEGRAKERPKTSKPGAEEVKEETPTLKKPVVRKPVGAEGQTAMLPVDSEPPKLKKPVPRASKMDEV